MTISDTAQPQSPDGEYHLEYTAIPGYFKQDEEDFDGFSFEWVGAFYPLLWLSTFLIHMYDDCWLTTDVYDSGCTPLDSFLVAMTPMAV